MNMIRFSFFMVLSLSTGIIYAQKNSTVSNSFSLQQCVDYAMENNPNVIIATYEKDIADTQIKETLSQGLPQANVDLGINYNFEPQKSLIDISTFDPSVPEGTEQEVSFQQQYDGNLNFNVRQLIFDGSFFVGLQAANTFKELSTKDHIKTKIDVVEAVSKAYYTALVTEEQYNLLEVNFARLDSLLSETQAMFDQGFVEKIDVSRLKVQHNNLKVQLKNTKELAKVSYDLLKFQMGMPIATEIELTDDLEEVSLDILDEQGFDYGSRIEYSQLQTNLALINLDIKNNRVQYLPNLYANFNYGYNTQAAESNQWFQTNRWLSYGFVGLSLNVPVFDGFLKRSRIQRNKIQLSQTEQSFKLLENTIDLEIKQSKINMSTALDNMEAQRTNKELAEEIYNVTRLKYQEGIGSNFEVVEADEDFKAAQTNYYNAL
ncbi:MAG: TolC family protein, partial [Bacteroidota bacterium]